MKKTATVMSAIVLAIFVAWSCSSLDPIAPDDVNTGNASFERFHAIGCSYTAGMQNGGLVEGFQKVAWPALVAKAAHAPVFEFPNISENGIPPTMYVRNFSPVGLDTLDTMGSPTNLTYAGVYNNMGIPSATLHMLKEKRPDPLDPNPFFSIVLRDSVPFGGAATCVAQTAAAHPTLLAVWVGITEILGPAKAGTDGMLTPAAWFELEYREMMDTFASTAGGVIAANIPDITLSPYFRAIPPIVINPATGQPVLDPGGNPVPLLGEYPGAAANEYRLLPDALVLLPASSQLAMGIGIPLWIPGGGSDIPLGDGYILDGTEAAAIRARIGEFNDVIDSVCANRGIPVVDIHALYERWATDGFEMRGDTYTTAYLSGSLFSVDGLHPNVIGHYSIALEFIGVINRAYKAAIPDPVLPLGPFRDISLGAAQ